MRSEAAARLTAYADQLDAYRSGRSDDDPGDAPIEDIRALLAEHEQCSGDLESLRKSVRAAWPLIEPTWNALVAWVVPLWRQLEPLLAVDESVEVRK